jgi:large subunit ribosomal protein L10
MPKTKEQKKTAVDEAGKELKKTQTLILTDFAGLTANKINTLRTALRSAGMKFHVIKKRLLKIVFKTHGINMDPTELKGQVGIVFSESDITESAQAVYKFYKKNKKRFKLLGGIEVEEKKILTTEEINAIGALPSREVLLGQLVGMIAAPIRSFLYVINEKSKQPEVDK